MELYAGAPAPSASPTTNFNPDLCEGFHFVGDVDGDGFADMACMRNDVGTNRNVPVIVFGAVDNFGARRTALDSEWTTAHSSTRVFMAEDFNGDGFADIVVNYVANVQSSGAWLRVHFGAAPFVDGPPGWQAFGPIELSRFSVDVPGSGGDLDGDGFVDLVLSHVEAFTATRATVQIYKGGVLPDPTAHTDLILGRAGSGIPAGDVDGDGFFDLLVSVEGGYGLYRGGSPLPTTPPLTPPLFTDWFARAGFDLNGDGRSDSLFYTSSGHVVYLGGSPISMTNAALSALSVTPGTFLTFSDYNGDGRQDFASGIGGTAPEFVRVLGDGTLDPPGSPLIGPADAYKLTGYNY